MVISQQRHVLVTGASGFIGKALVARLVSLETETSGQEAGATFEVRAAVRNAAQTVSPALQSVVGDIDGNTNWASALQGVETVAHLAARVHVMRDVATDPLAEFRRVNVEGTLALARQAASAGVKRFVYLSSIKVNGERGVFTERDTPAPVDPYGVSKLEAEAGLRNIAASSGMGVVIIRPPLVYGPGVKANFRALFGAVRRGYPLPLGAIHNKRSLVALDNLIDLIVVALTHPQAVNETFLVSDGVDLSTTELVQRMARALGHPARLVPVPASVLRFGAKLVGRRDTAARLLDSLQVDISKARTVLGWKPPVSVDEGLQKVAAVL